MSERENWLERWLGQEEVVCICGKEPDPDKIESFCRTTEEGTGCSNLVPRSALEGKPGTYFGKRKRSLER